MFGLNTAIRSVATGVAASVDSASRTFVGSLTLVETAVTRRLDEKVQKAKTLQLHAEIYKDVQETAKSTGFTSVEEMKDKVSSFMDSL
jgi:hypothetical protein|nr:MAG TPA: hypothetical protein [Caudoviricetes sp.]DAX34550.1 MAG TPA: hypothetical protein [Caudoviricetes sp.]